MLTGILLIYEDSGVLRQHQVYNTFGDFFKYQLICMKVKLLPDVDQSFYFKISKRLSHTGLLYTDFGKYLTFEYLRDGR